MRAFSLIRVLLLAALLSPGLGAPALNAARDKTPPPRNGTEILVLEIRDCTICSLVRTRIEPAYQLTPRARSVPLRYVDITSMDETKLGLSARVDTVPTIVIMRDGREIERITGYMGPGNFLRTVDWVLGPDIE